MVADDEYTNGPLIYFHEWICLLMLCALNVDVSGRVCCDSGHVHSLDDSGHAHSLDPLIEV